MIEAQQTIARSMSAGLPGMFGEGMTVPTADLAQPDLARTIEAMMEMWSTATGLSSDLTKQIAQSMGGAPIAGGLFDRIADPRQWLAGAGVMDDMLAGLADAPRLADLFDVERRTADIMRRWTELRQRSLEHQRVLLDAWMKAGQTYLTELAGRTTAAGKPLEPKQVLALWTEIGNRTLFEAQRSEPFLASQRAVIRASTELRLVQSEFSEHFGKQLGLPTRTEIDDVHRTLTEMRRELRRTRRELDALRARGQQAEPPAKAARSTMPRSTRSEPALRKAR